MVEGVHFSWGLGGVVLQLFGGLVVGCADGGWVGCSGGFLVDNGCLG